MNHQNWHGLTDARYGYGSMVVGFLENKPDDLVIDPKASVDCYMGVPFNVKGWNKGAYRACLTMWETDELPTKFIQWLSQYDEIIVPCEHNVELFHQHHPNVNHIPLGVDTSFWKPYDRKPNNRFRFHAAGSLWMRKGLDKVVEAFNNLDLPDAELHLKVAPHAKDVPDRIPGKNVFIHREWMDKQTQRDWFNQADCFVAPARGEGFGLIPLQAIALGIPTIVSKTSGQEQFSHLAASVVSSRKEPSVLGGRWDEPNLEHLMQLMKLHYTHRDNLAVEAKLRASKADEFSWKKAAKKLADHLPRGHRLENPKRVQPSVYYPMEVTNRCACEVNGVRWEFVPGKVYQVPDNVREVMSANGTLKESR